MLRPGVRVPLSPPNKKVQSFWAFCLFWVCYARKILQNDFTRNFTRDFTLNFTLSRRRLYLSQPLSLTSFDSSPAGGALTPSENSLTANFQLPCYAGPLRLEQGRLTHCRSQFSLFLPVLRFALSATGGAQLRTSKREPFGVLYKLL